MRDFELVAGGTYKTRNGILVTLETRPESVYLTSDVGFDYDPKDLEEGHLVFEGETHDHDLMERIS